MMQKEMLEGEMVEADRGCAGHGTRLDIEKRWKGGMETVMRFRSEVDVKRGGGGSRWSLSPARDLIRWREGMR